MNAKAFQPEYFSKFECLASRCEDTCCRGWQIAVDRDFCERCKAYPEERMRKSLLKSLDPKGKDAPAGGFASIRLESLACPFLTEDKLCRLQQAEGEAFLSDLCRSFPRVFNLVDGVPERSLGTACPQSARLVLLDNAPMAFGPADTGTAFFPGDAPVLDTRDPAYNGTPYPHFHAIRRFVISLLQNRAYPLEDRLTLLGRFCSELEGTSGAGRAGELTLDFERNAGLHRFDEFLSSVPYAPASQLKTLAALLEYRLREGCAGLFSGCFERFRQGLRYSQAASAGDLAWSYRRVKEDYYDAFMREHGYMLENYLVNYAFYTLFPLGPQKCGYPKSMYMAPRGIFANYMLFAVHYAFVKNLLTRFSTKYRQKWKFEPCKPVFIRSECEKAESSDLIHFDI